MIRDKIRSLICMCLLFGIGLGSGCTSLRQKIAARHDSEPSVNSVPDAITTPKERVAVDLDHQVVSSMKFPTGRDGVGPNAASVIDRTLAEAKRNGQIEVIEVAVWSDAEYPAKK